MTSPRVDDVTVSLALPPEVAADAAVSGRTERSCSDSAARHDDDVTAMTSPRVDDVTVSLALPPEVAADAVVSGRTERSCSDSTASDTCRASKQASK